jgi:hypothetical protein
MPAQRKYPDSLPDLGARLAACPACRVFSFGPEPFPHPEVRVRPYDAGKAGAGYCRRE